MRSIVSLSIAVPQAENCSILGKEQTTVSHAFVSSGTVHVQILKISQRRNASNELVADIRTFYPKSRKATELCNLVAVESSISVSER